MRDEPTGSLKSLCHGPAVTWPPGAGECVFPQHRDLVGRQAPGRQFDDQEGLQVGIDFFGPGRREVRDGFRTTVDGGPKDLAVLCAPIRQGQ